MHGSAAVQRILSGNHTTPPAGSSMKRRWFGILIAAALLLLLVRYVDGKNARSEWDEPRIYTARKIITLDADAPVATAVGVEAGRVVAVGDLATVRAHFGDLEFTVDDRFRDRFLVPGFVDPHIHPSLAATILPLEIVSAMSWSTPRGQTTPVRGHDAFIARLRELDRALIGEPHEWLIVWGYHAPYHGTLSRAELDAVSKTRPILVWQRSVHEMFVNSAALAAADFTRAEFDAHPMADWDTGHLWEAGLLTLGQPFVRRIAAPRSYLEGLSMMTEVLHRGGLTTVGEQGSPQVAGFVERLALWLEMRDDDTPYRFVLVPNAMYLLREHGSAQAAEAAAAELLDWSSERIRFVKHVKYYADGAIYSQLMKMSEPYLDGHHGEWMMTPEEQAEVLEAFWNEGWQVHVHVNGDAGLDLVLDQVEERQRSQPDPDRLVVMEHYGYAREDQHARLAALGIEVSNNAYYAHELAPIYAEVGLGPDRAADISPVGGLARANVPTSFHSDFPMAPAEPLRQMWVAVNRIGSDGRVWGEDQRIGVERALRAVTIEAARSLGLEDEVGSIRVGKRAD